MGLVCARLGYGSPAVPGGFLLPATPLPLTYHPLAPGPRLMAKKGKKKKALKNSCCGKPQRKMCKRCPRLALP